MIVILAYGAISLYTLYCVLTGVLCHVGKGSRGYNRQIKKLQVTPRVHLICFMIIYEMPYFSAQFCRILILEYSDYVD